MSDLQSLFDRVASHLLLQGERSVQESSGGCMYRNGAGLSCAVGVLITDEAYAPAMEWRSLDDEPVLDALRQSGVADSAEVLSLLNELQEVHDITPIPRWESQLAYLAEVHNLRFERDALMTLRTTESQDRSDG